MTGRQRAGDRTSPRPPACWRCIAFTAAATGTALSALAFAFCVIAPAYGWHRPMPKLVTLATIVVMFACAGVVRLTLDDE